MRSALPRHGAPVALLAVLACTAAACGSSSADAPATTAAATGAGGAGGGAGGATTTSTGTATSTGGGGGAGGSGGAAPCAIDTCAYPDLAVWQSPIEDYVAKASETLDAGKLHKAIDDLVVFDDRLYFGYGDATLNAGRVVDIQIRYWDDPSAGAPKVDLAKTDEEEISVFRRFGDTLYIPGVDATEDAFLGNVFSRPKGGAWTKHRSVNGGVHVHDVAEWGGALYACGSGALDLETWNTGKVHSWLWRSGDGAATWEAAADVPNEEVGDRRWVQLVPFPDELLVFGYRTNAAGNITALLESAWDGKTLKDASVAPGHFVLGTEMLDPTTAVLRTVATAGALKLETLVAHPGAPAEVVEGLVGLHAVDVAIVEPGSALVLAAQNDKYPAATKPPPWHVLHTRDFVTFTKLVSTTTKAWPSAVAYWRGGLYVGLADGTVLRSVPQ